jgi:hypothetical protein
VCAASLNRLQTDKTYNKWRKEEGCHYNISNNRITDSIKVGMEDIRVVADRQSNKDKCTMDNEAGKEG